MNPFDDSDIVTIEAPVYLSKEELEMIRKVCRESFCTIQDFIQSAADEAIFKLKASTEKKL